MSFTDIMIDLETLSTETNACIIAIGAVKFNLYNSSIERISIELLIDVSSCEEIKCHKCNKTIEWWNRQDQNILKHLLDDEPRIKIKDAIIKLNEFGKGCSRFWSQGSFDYNILEANIKMINTTYNLNISPVWKFWQIRDVRTIADLCKDIPKKPVNAHSPVVDCNHQIDVLHFVYNKINAKESILGKRTITFDINKGDWECDDCNNMNFSSRTKCFSCYKLKKN